MFRCAGNGWLELVMGVAAADDIPSASYEEAVLQAVGPPPRTSRVRLPVATDTPGVMGLKLSRELDIVLRIVAAPTQPLELIANGGRIAEGVGAIDDPIIVRALHYTDLHIRSSQPFTEVFVEGLILSRPVLERALAAKYLLTPHAEGRLVYREGCCALHIEEAPVVTFKPAKP